MDTTTTKDKLARFGRSMAMMLNRGLMYQKSHPMVKESINDVHKIAQLLFTSISPLVFILNRDQFYVDEEQLDPRINVRRIATLFKSHKIQSVSFENGLTPSELDIFIDIFASMTMSTDAEYLKKALFTRGAFNIKINHVLYKKVTQDDQIISREALKEVTPSMEGEDSQSRKKFMDTLLETILTEEFANTLNIKSLLANPRLVSQNMIKADLASARQFEKTQFKASAGSGSGSPGDGTAAGGGGGAPGSDGSGAGPGSGSGGAGDGTAAGGTGGGAPGSDGSGAGPGWGPGGSGHGTAAGGASGMVGISATIATPETAMRSGYSSSGSAAHAGPVGNASAEEFRKVADIPQGADPALAGDSGGHGPMLIHQLELIQAEVQNQLEGEGEVSLEDLAACRLQAGRF
jgi:hypothetical protein